MGFIFKLLIIIAGVFMVLKTEWLVSNFGASAWAEEHMGTSGGTRLLYKLIGIIIIFLTMMAMTGLLGPTITNIFGRLFSFK